MLLNGGVYRIAANQARCEFLRRIATYLKCNFMRFDMPESALFKQSNPHFRIMKAERDLVESWRIVVKKACHDFVCNPAKRIFRITVPYIECEETIIFQDPLCFTNGSRLIRNKHHSKLTDNRGKHTVWKWKSGCIRLFPFD